MSIERKRGFLRLNDSDPSSEKWELPEYKGGKPKIDLDTSAINYEVNWDLKSAIQKEVIVPLTEQEKEEIKQAAHQEGMLQGQEAGFNQGYEKGKVEGAIAGHEEGMQVGKEEGIVQGEEYIQKEVEILVSLIEQFSQPLELMNNQVEKQLIDMVLLLVKEIVLVEVQTSDEIVLNAIRESVTALPISANPITIRLNPEDSTVIRNYYSDEDLDNRKWTLVIEPTLKRGDMQIEAGESMVNYNMQERVNSVIQRFCGMNHHQTLPQ